MKAFSLCIAAMLLLPCCYAKAATQSTCPDKVLHKGTVEGVFKGNECEDFCWSTITLDNGEDFSFLMPEHLVEKSFGKGTGQRVFVTYEVKQFWNELGGECSRLEVFVSGKVLAAPGQAAQKIPAR